MALALALTFLVLIVAPGLAVVAILAISVVLVCGASLALGGRRHARQARSRTRRVRRSNRQARRPPRRPVARR